MRRRASRWSPPGRRPRSRSCGRIARSCCGQEGMFSPTPRRAAAGMDAPGAREQEMAESTPRRRARLKSGISKEKQRQSAMQAQRNGAGNASRADAFGTQVPAVPSAGGFPGELGVVQGDAKKRAFPCLPCCYYVSTVNPVVAKGDESKYGCLVVSTPSASYPCARPLRARDCGEPRQLPQASLRTRTRGPREAWPGCWPKEEPRRCRRRGFAGSASTTSFTPSQHFAKSGTFSRYSSTTGARHAVERGRGGQRSAWQRALIHIPGCATRVT